MTLNNKQPEYSWNTADMTLNNKQPEYSWNTADMTLNNKQPIIQSMTYYNM
jgi:hypothetical protein